MITGFITKKVTYVCQAKETIEVYDDDDFSENLISKSKVYPAYPVEDGKSLDNAIKWSGLDKPLIESFDNTEIDNIKVCCLDYRGNGGRAYKVIINDKFYVDMREDVILDTMITCGIEKEGILKGKYVWAKYGGNMKLVRVGSYSHSIYLKGKDPSEMKEIPKSEIVIGGIYRMKSGNTSMYLGKYKTYQYRYWEKSGYFVRSEDRYQEQRYEKATVHLFADVNEYDFPNPVTLNPKRVISQKPYYIRMKTSVPKFYEKLAQHDISSIDILKIIKDVIIKDNDESENPYLHNLRPDHLNLGIEPEIHPSIKHFNIPIVDV